MDFYVGLVLGSRSLTWAFESAEEGICFSKNDVLNLELLPISILDVSDRIYPPIIGIFSEED